MDSEQSQQNSETTLAGVTLEAHAQVRYNFAVQHLLTAARFARLCYAVETANAGKPFGPFFEEIISYVTASVFSSVAALEANINELIVDMQDGSYIPSNVGPKLLHEFLMLIDEKSTLDKYQLILVLLGKNKMPAGQQKYQFADTLIDVRNALIHFRPEWHHQKQKHERISRKLRGKFVLSQFDTTGPIFPRRCMTHGFAEWAVHSVLNFMNHFAQEAGVKYRFAHLSSDMRTTP